VACNMAIDKFVEHACKAIVIRESRRVSWSSDEDRAEAETVIKKVRQKRPMTDELLMRVAGLYNASPYRKIEKITEAEGIANSTARLYVSEARKRGILRRQRAERQPDPSMQKGLRGGQKG
jgi:hypothetical protein